jgi:hypothetical protein
MDDVLKQALDRVLDEYHSKDYVFWRDYIGKDAIVLPHPSNPDLRIEVSAMWDRVNPPGGPIRVLVSTFELRPSHFRVRVPTAPFLVLEDGTIHTFEDERS